MWDETLIESRGTRERRKGWFSIPIALLAHVVVVVVLVGTSYWYVEAVQGPPPVPVFLISFVPSGGGGEPVRAHQQKPEPVRVDQEVQPQEIPQEIHQDQKPQEQNSVTEPNSNFVEGAEGVEGSGPGIPGLLPGFGSGTGNGLGVGEGAPIIITPDVQQPVLIRKVQPIYPPLAIRAHIHGIVLLQAVISRTGSVEDLKVLQSPHPILEQAAIDAVKQWKYRPAMVNGRPVRVYFNVVVEFKLI